MAVSHIASTCRPAALKAWTAACLVAPATLIGMGAVSSAAYAQRSGTAPITATADTATTVTTATTTTTPFTREVLRDFAMWDTDQDGVLSQEIDKAIADPRMTAEAAAALGAMKMAVRSGRFELPPFTRDYFTGYSSYIKLHPVRRVRAATPEDTVATTPTAATAVTPVTTAAAATTGTIVAPATADPKKKSTDYPHYDVSYRSGVLRIQRATASVFTMGAPRLEDVRQGQIGDCYFLAVVGAMLNRDPAAVRQMIAPQPSGSCDVTFPIGKTAHVPPLTDAELAIASGSHGTGRWLTILEVAFGQVRNDAITEPDKQKEIATDLIANGGSSRAVIRLLLGHQTGGITFRKRGVPEMPSAEEVASKVTAAREAIVAALKEKRLVTLGTQTADLPPAISPKHAYALIGYDAATDRVRVWNPHGNTYQPKGEPGLKYGYATKDGIFTLPLTEVARIFNGMTWEKDLPVTDSTMPTTAAAAAAAPKEASTATAVTRKL